MEIARDEVRVMTVHGAKGLEAPIVILADAATPPSGPPQRQPRLLPLPTGHAAPGAPDRLVWAGAKPTEVPPITAAKEKYRRSAADEHRRLLYVAMTRAADRLIVCGIQGERERPEGCWYDLVLDALRDTATEMTDEDGAKLWRLEKFTGEEETGAAGRPESKPIAVPDWLRRSARGETPSVVVSPSTILDEVPTPFARASVEREQALLRGRLVHRLIQSLPDIPAERRRTAAQTFLARSAPGFTESESEALIAQVLAVIDDPRFAPLAGPGSRAEVPIVGRIARAGGPPLFVSGQVDRLAVTADAVTIADYKTNRPAPRRLDEVPEPYLAQLALYRAVLGQLYPGRPIQALLVWTDVPDFMEISAAALDTALAHVTAAKAAS
jgi:ATP-dependent helicase/nuclease subunit A